MIRQRPQRPLSRTDPRRPTRNRHGLSSVDVDAMLAAQRGRCAICGTSDFGREGPVIDHDHGSAARHGHPVSRGCPPCVRGILFCSGENQGLARFGDDPARLPAGRRVPRARPRETKLTPIQSQVLDHPRRVEIEAAIRSGRRRRGSLSEEFGVSVSTLRRYAHRLSGPARPAKNTRHAPDSRAVAASDPVRAFKESSGMDPTPYQERLLVEKRHTVVLKGRQTGFTQAAAALAIDCARSRAGALAAVISPQPATEHGDIDARPAGTPGHERAPRPGLGLAASPEERQQDPVAPGQRPGRARVPRRPAGHRRGRVRGGSHLGLRAPDGGRDRRPHRRPEHPRRARRLLLGSARRQPLRRTGPSRRCAATRRPSSTRSSWRRSGSR